ncbi:pre-mRNA splicing factor, putative [Ichthyophthirius multifiliis]|uniref:Pre-mRNA-splicing factor 38 n=1 Tax=Ichthyophthirius multifiliis TaxID=5932 RepID=G0QNS3_ICHMU|nr:pre-mRNA splicing factor, putative [Ichthyophthirius multifiliis]EGR33114.1 pre-mRNA splicing factor, putative [Ichthyophthirius multifiliis]|eukprot:XP_004037100.1 pre-mRNA splicing factor, putative [Ichthyophthirius multifiliis]
MDQQNHFNYLFQQNIDQNQFYNPYPPFQQQFQQQPYFQQQQYAQMHNQLQLITNLQFSDTLQIPGIMDPKEKRETQKKEKMIAHYIQLQNQKIAEQENDQECELIEYQPTGEKGDNIFQIWGDETSGNINPKLRTNIMNCSYFRIDLFSLKTYHEVIEEIQKNVNHAEPWARGATGVPSSMFCCLYKFMLMKLTVKQVRGLVEYKFSPMVRAAGFLYIRFCCDPKYMFAWFKKYLLDDEDFKPGADKNSPSMTIGDYVEGLLNNQEYYNTRLPRIPTKYETKLKAKLIINQEKRNRKKRNLDSLDYFTKERKVKAISRQDEEWHEGIVEKVEGKLIMVRFIPNREMNFEGCNELVNLGEIELLGQNEYEDNKKIENKKQSKSKSKSVRKSQSRSRSKKRSSSKKRKHKKQKNTSHLHKRSKKISKRSRSYKRERRSRSNSNKRIRKQETMREREQRLEKQIIQENANKAVAYSKSDVARIPQSYKTSLSGNHPKGSLINRLPSPTKKEEFVETIIPSVIENRQKKKEDDAKNKPQPSEKQLQNTRQVMEIYGDASTKGQIITYNKQARDYA